MPSPRAIREPPADHPRRRIAEVTAQAYAKSCAVWHGKFTTVRSVDILRIHWRAIHREAVLGAEKYLDPFLARAVHVVQVIALPQVGEVLGRRIRHPATLALE